MTRRAQSMTERIEIEKRVQKQQRRKRKMRSELEDREDEIARLRKEMIRDAEKRINSTMNTDDLFVIQWSVK